MLQFDWVSSTHYFKTILTALMATFYKNISRSQLQNFWRLLVLLIWLFLQFHIANYLWHLMELKFHYIQAFVIISIWNACFFGSVLNAACSFCLNVEYFDLFQFKTFKIVSLFSVCSCYACLSTDYAWRSYIIFKHKFPKFKKLQLSLRNYLTKSVHSVKEVIVAQFELKIDTAYCHFVLVFKMRTYL